MAVRATGADAPRPTIPPLGEGKHSAWPGAPPARRPGPGRWGAPLTDLPGVGPTLARNAGALGIRTVGDLLEHLPARYEAFDEGVRPLSSLRPGEEVTVRVILDDIAVRPTRRRSLRLVRARIHDASGRFAATWFNQDHLARVLHPGDELLIRGKVGGDAMPYALLSTPSSRKLLKVLRSPLTLNAPSRGVSPPVFSAEARTPSSATPAPSTRGRSAAGPPPALVTTWPR